MRRHGHISGRRRRAGPLITLFSGRRGSRIAAFLPRRYRAAWRSARHVRGGRDFDAPPRFSCARGAKGWPMRAIFHGGRWGKMLSHTMMGAFDIIQCRCPAAAYCCTSLSRVIPAISDDDYFLLDATQGYYFPGRLLIAATHLLKLLAAYPPRLSQHISHDSLL